MKFKKNYFYLLKNLLKSSQKDSFRTKTVDFPRVCTKILELRNQKIKKKKIKSKVK